MKDYSIDSQTPWVTEQKIKITKEKSPNNQTDNTGGDRVEPTKTNRTRTEMDRKTEKTK